MINTLFTSLEIKLYYIQQYIYIFFSYHLNQMSIYMLILLFISGVLTIINPCLISILPLFFVYINYDHRKSINRQVFMLGLLTSIITIMILISLFYKYYQNFFGSIPIFSALLTIIVGLNLLQILKWNLFLINFRRKYQVKLNKIIIDWVIGFIVGISSSSCSTPILITIIVWLSSSHNLSLAIIYIIFYLLGYSFCGMILFNITITYSEIILFTKIWNYIISISGSLILGNGIFSFLEKIFI